MGRLIRSKSHHAVMALLAARVDPVAAVRIWLELRGATNSLDAVTPGVSSTASGPTNWTSSHAAWSAKLHAAPFWSPRRAQACRVSRRRSRGRGTRQRDYDEPGAARARRDQSVHQRKAEVRGQPREQGRARAASQSESKTWRSDDRQRRACWSAKRSRCSPWSLPATIDSRQTSGLTTTRSTRSSARRNGGHGEQMTIVSAQPARNLEACSHFHQEGSDHALRAKGARGGFDNRHARCLCWF